MARPLRVQFPGAFYHITCRGIERRDIFADDKDRHRFLDLLSGSVKTYQVLLHAFVLMRNHFHLLIQTRKANCAEFMRHFNICYTGWFNWRHSRAGSLYQGRYQGFLIDADAYLLEVSRYLHLNSVRVRPRGDRTWQDQWAMARAYPWSSLRGYLSDQKAVSLVHYDLILEMAGGRRAYGDFVRDGLHRDLDNPFQQVKNQFILGDEQFVSRIKEQAGVGSLREQPAYRDLVIDRLEPERVLVILSKVMQTDLVSLRQPRGSGVIRGIAAELLYRYCDLTQTQLGRLLGGIDYMAVYQLRRRLLVKLGRDRSVQRMFDKAEAAIKKALL